MRPTAHVLLFISIKDAGARGCENAMSLFEKSSAKTFLKNIYYVAIMAIDKYFCFAFFWVTFSFAKEKVTASHYMFYGTVKRYKGR